MSSDENLFSKSNILCYRCNNSSKIIHYKHLHSIKNRHWSTKNLYRVYSHFFMGDTCDLNQFHYTTTQRINFGWKGSLWLRESNPYLETCLPYFNLFFQNKSVLDPPFPCVGFLHSTYFYTDTKHFFQKKNSQSFL